MWSENFHCHSNARGEVMGLVKTRRRLAEDGSPHRVMRKQQRAKAGW